MRWITHCSHAIVLENLVYYRNDTHYLVMTAKADCLVRAGVCRTVSGKARPDEPLAHRPPTSALYIAALRAAYTQRCGLCAVCIVYAIGRRRCAAPQRYC